MPMVFVSFFFCSTKIVRFPESDNTLWMFFKLHFQTTAQIQAEKVNVYHLDGKPFQFDQIDDKRKPKFPD